MELLRGMALILANDEHADARSLRYRFDHVRGRHGVGAGGFLTGEHDGFGDRNAGGAHDRLGLLLMHGEGRGEHA